MSLNTIPGIGGDGSVTATTTPQKIANSLSVQRVVTISSLKGVAGTVDGETVLAEGYDVRGDCEPLSYYWDADSVLADDGVDSTHPGLIIQPTGVSGAGRWVARRPSYINVKWYGAKGNNVQDDQPYIQRACYEAIHRYTLWPSEVFIPGGTYVIGSGILLKKDLNGDKEPEAFSLYIRGEGGFPYNATGYTQLRCTHNDTFCFGAQLAKGLVIQSLLITGQNNITFTSSYDAFTSPESEYVVNGCRDNTYSPYTAICIDPFGRTGIVAEADRYPGYSAEYTPAHGQGGSTDVKIEQCRIEKFVCAFCFSPNGYTLNAEQIELNRCRIDYCKVGIAPCQLQSRSVRIYDMTMWTFVLYMVNCSLYGQGSGQVPYLEGCNIAGNVKYCFYANSTVSTVQINAFFAESFYSLGRISTDAVSFVGCMLKWALPTTTNASALTMFSTDKQVTFRDCTLIHSSNPPTTMPLKISASRMRFYGCTLDAPVQNSDPQVDNVHYDNCFFRNFTTSADGQNSQYSSGGRIITNAFAGKNGMPIAPGQEIQLQFPDAASVRQYGKIYRNVAHTQRIENVAGGNSTLTINNANQTATFTAAIPIRWDITTRGSCPIVMFNLRTDEFGTSVYPCGFVSNVSGSVVTLTGLPVGLTDGAYAIQTIMPYRWHEPCIGTTTNGSAIITNVRCETAVTSVWRVGEMISGAGIPVGTFVTARDNTAKTITLSQNATATASGIDLYDAPLICRAFAPAQPATGAWTKGDLIDDTTGATNGWRCTGSGTFGSGTDPTFATR